MTARPDRLDDLIAAARAGDRAAYRAFLDEAAGRLRAFIARRLADRNEVEDLLQECLIAIHEKRGTLDPGRPVAPWMYTIARYKLTDRWRKIGRQPLMVAEHDAPVAAESDAALDVEALLDRLPPAQAEAIRLTRIEGLTGQEASERVGIGTSAMKLRVHRGMLALKKMVAPSE